MPSLKLPASVTAITIATVVRPIDGNNEIVVTDAEAAVLVPQQFQPKVVSTLANGDCTIKVPAIVDSLSIGATPFGADASSNIIGVGPLAAVSFLRWAGAKVFEYAHA